MIRYHINDIHINKINNNNILNLKKKFNYSSSKNLFLLSDSGLYKYIDDTLYKLVINYNYKQSFSKIKNYTLIHSKNNFIKLKYPVKSIPFNHSPIIKELFTFKNNHNSNTSLIIEYTIINNEKKINDIYFLSSLNCDDFSFKEDISYFIDLLI